ncbi:MAG: enoyl-CoA hydratase [Nocardioides sp.]|nr:enoyl-CoA hydratase [Nocardioides sp.]
MDGVLEIERRDRILVLTMSRPHVRNAIDQALASAIAAALDDLDADDGLSVAVLTGAGGTFSSGMDLEAFARGERVATDRGFGGITERPPEKPVIAAVEGWALAGGCEIALACDLLVAARDAQFGIPEVKRGLVAAAGGLSRLPLALPYQVAMELALTGEPIGAERAHSFGMVNRLVEPGQALTEALSLAGAVAANGPLAVRTSKWIMATASGWTGATTWEPQREKVAEIMGSHDATEGATAFAEKRTPRWLGR